MKVNLFSKHEKQKVALLLKYEVTNRSEMIMLSVKALESPLRSADIITSSLNFKNDSQIRPYSCGQCNLFG
jgi:hypothetical protein